MLIKKLGLRPYEPIWLAMREFTNIRNDDTEDELWVVQHPPVFTQGQAGKAEHILDAGDIPVVKSDRGGQVTYHGPGQVVIYPLLNLKRYDLGVRALVTLIEDSVIALLAHYDVSSETLSGAPGIYVGDNKIASLGLRIRRGCSYHGVGLNVNMDLSPFQRINPCGYNGLKMTQLVDVTRKALPVLDVVEHQLLEQIQTRLILKQDLKK